MVVCGFGEGVDTDRLCDSVVIDSPMSCSMIWSCCRRGLAVRPWSIPIVAVSGMTMVTGPRRITAVTKMSVASMMAEPNTKSGAVTSLPLIDPSRGLLRSMTGTRKFDDYVKPTSVDRLGRRSREERSLEALV